MCFYLMLMSLIFTGGGGGSNIVVHVLRIKQTNRRTLIADDPLGWAEKSSDIALSAHWPPI